MIGIDHEMSALMYCKSTRLSVFTRVFRVKNFFSKFLL